MTVRAAQFEPIGLRVDGAEDPLGIDAPRPRLSWRLGVAVRDGRSPRGHAQTAYRVIVAREADPHADGENLTWDSGKVPATDCTGIRYDGPVLRSRARYIWRVMAWDHADRPSRWSEPGWWEMALLDPGGWDDASWIGPPTPRPSGRRGGPQLRRSFRLDRPVRRARVYATALGVYELHLNGSRVGQDVLAPGWTDYRRRVQYQTYDVTEAMRPGENVLGALLGAGWFTGHVGWFGASHYGTDPRLRAILVVEHEDGSLTRIGTDDRWRSADGPVLSSDLLMGEVYDARADQPGWSTPDFDDGAWAPVEAAGPWPADLVAQAAPPIRVTEELMPAAVTEPVPGRWVFDLGQNMVGWVRLRVAGEQGRRVVLRFSEALNPDGTIYTDNLRTAAQTDEYVLHGRGEEVFEPHFTYHGFRYVEVSGYPGRPDPAAVRGLVAHATMPVTGDFSCSHPLLNQLYRNIVWSQRGNFVAVPTDCPQRDERLGWSGDIQVFASTAAFAMDVERFLAKWLRDLADAQHESGAVPDVAPDVGDLGAGAAGWGDAALVVPVALHEAYGDRGVLEENYPAMARWVDYLVRDSRDRLRGAEGYGDWLSVDAETPKDVVATAYFAYSARLMAHVAGILGRHGEAERYEALFREVRAAFRARFVREDGRIEGHTQTAYVLALHIGLLDDDERPEAARWLVRDLEARDWHLSTGFLGTPWLLPVLTESGHLDVAYRLLLQETCPSWLYPVTCEATTIWERWDGWTEDRGYQAPEVTQGLPTPAMNSFNHYAFGAVGSWLVRTVAGLSPAAPGYREIAIHPQPGGGLTWARADYDSAYGRITSAWRIADGRFWLEVAVPAGCRATVTIPAPHAEDVQESGSPITDVPETELVDTSDGRVVLAVPSGEYLFTAPAPDEPGAAWPTATLFS